MILNAESAMSAWAAKWSETWDTMLTDLMAAQEQIQSACSAIAAELSRISVNVNISGGGGYGGYGGGGSGGMDWDFASGSDWLAPTGDWSEYSGGGSINYVNTGGGGCSIGGGGCTNGGYQDGCTGMVINPLKYTSPSGTVTYINPMNYNSGLGLSGSGSGIYTGGLSGGTYSGSPSGYQLPAIFAAHGALLDDGPNRIVAGEAGPELVIPAKYTRLMDWMAGQVENLRGGGSAQNIVVEDHTEHYWYMDGKEVSNQVMKNVQKRLQLRGAVPNR
jgi:hypothetical protein